MRFPPRVDAPAAASGVRVLEVVLGLDASDANADVGDEASKLNLNQDDGGGVEGAVTMGSALIGAEKDLICLPGTPAVDGEKVALPRKLMLSTET